MTKKPLFWLCLSIASLLCLLFSWQFFASAFPFYNADISMSREAAEAAAKERVTRLQLAPRDARAAVRFSSDDATQNFIELEGGGKEAFVAMLQNDVYAALRWEVRFYREKDASLTTLFFSPQGKPLGFVRHLAEKETGPALSAAQARQLAEQAARRDWGLDISAQNNPYRATEESFNTLPNGRVDHLFIYERFDQKLGKNGEGRVQLALAVAGDQFVKLHYSVKIPSSFERRFAQMRASNTTISFTANLAVGVLYVFGGCLVGLMLLQRLHFVVSRPAVIFAGVIALLQGAAALNQLPLSWFHYDTALSSSTFIWQQVGIALMVFLFTWVMLALSFIAAEGLTRKAFGEQPQLWRVWQAGAGNSDAILGRTVAGYLWVGFDLAFIALFYYGTQQYLGWWSPLSSLVDPNILATPMPWLPPVANALQAGVWEECLFRAVPLAGAALIGDFLQRRYAGHWLAKFGGRNRWLLFALILQALIFGAAHATYAQQPAYARPVELFLPALVWGVVYLRFGLLPGIIFHFVFDLLLMAMPLFATQAPGLGWDRAIVIVCGAMPLLMVLWARWRAGKWQALPSDFLNSAWQAPSQLVLTKPHIIEAKIDSTQERQVWLHTRRVLPVLGVLGALLWYQLQSFSTDSLPFYLPRAQAEQAADLALQQRGIKLDDQWQRFSHASRPHNEANDFVWREGGRDAYAKLMGSYLPPVAWKVRYLRLHGDVAERAEEWQVQVENGVDGRAGKVSAPHIRYIEHRLPEARPGKSLNVAEARSLAHGVLVERFKLPVASLREIAAEEIKRPHRKDWRFSYSDAAHYPLSKGEARLQIDIAGDEVVFAGRSVHVPEEWQRSERERAVVLQVVKGLAMLSILTLGISIIVIVFKRAFVSGGQYSLNRGVFIKVTGVMFVLEMLMKANTWQSIGMEINTTAPLTSQLWMQGGMLLFGWLFLALLIGLFASLAMLLAMHNKLGIDDWRKLIAPGIALACVLAGLAAAIAQLSSHAAPIHANFNAVNQVFPLLGAILQGASSTLIKLALFSVALILLQEFSDGFRTRRVLTLLFFIPLGFASNMDNAHLGLFLLQSLLSSAVFMLTYVTIARYEGKVLLFALLPSIFAQINHAVSAQSPDTAWYALLYVAAVLVTAAVWMMVWERKRHAPSA